MGMYDYVLCERTMPDGFDGRGAGFQSKDLACGLDTYVITDDGRLITDEYYTETVPKEERPYPNDDGLLGMCGMWRRVITGSRDTNYHGWLNFYTHDAAGNWREYNAKFTDGTLVEITVAEDAA